MEKGLQGIHGNKQLLLITPGNAYEQLVSSIIAASASHKGLVFLITANIFIATMHTEEQTKLGDSSRCPEDRRNTSHSTGISDHKEVAGLMS